MSFDEVTYAVGTNESREATGLGYDYGFGAAALGIGGLAAARGASADSDDRSKLIAGGAVLGAFGAHLTVAAVVNSFRSVDREKIDREIKRRENTVRKRCQEGAILGPPPGDRDHLGIHGFARPRGAYARECR